MRLFGRFLCLSLLSGLGCSSIATLWAQDTTPHRLPTPLSAPDGRTGAAQRPRPTDHHPPLPETRQGLYRGQLVTYQIIDGLAVAEGDIILGTPDEVSLDSPLNKAHDSGIVGGQYRWPNATIVYAIDANVPSQTRITGAIAAWQAATGIKFVARTTEADYVDFRRTGAIGVCSSSVGRIGGEQFVNTDDLCDQPVMIHEIGHAIGLYHEMSRQDRDRYITILTQNVARGSLSQYNQVLNSGEDIGNYDFSSIMHYWSGAFSGNGKFTMESIPPGIIMGERDQLSAQDIDTVQRLYGFAVRTTTIDTNPPNLTVQVDGANYTAPAVFTWAAGTTHTISATGPQLSSDGYTRYNFGRWGNDGTQTQTITVSPSQSVYTAHFIAQYKLVTYNTAPGSIAISPVSPDSFYTLRSALTATSTGGNFVHWYNYCGNTSVNPCAFTLDYGVGNYGLWASYAAKPPISITSNAPGVSVTVDGTAYQLPTAFDWSTGSSHTLAAATQSPYGGINEVFQNWSDGGAASHTMTAVASGAYTVNFSPQYQLLIDSFSTSSNAVTASPLPLSTGYYAAGTPVVLTANNSSSQQFLYWSGDTSGTATTQSLTMNQVHEADAAFVPAGCKAALSQTSYTVGAAGAVLNIPAGSGGNCYYYSYSMLAWADALPYAANGANTIALTISPNPGSTARTGVVTIGSQAVTITQSANASNCTFAFSPIGGASVPAAGGSVSITVQTNSGCSWTASPNESWLSGAGSGSATGTFTLTAAANPSTADRTGTLTIAGQPYVITQYGASSTVPACSYSLTPASASVLAAGASGTVQLTASSSTCAWTATSNASWVTITTGASGAGSGTVAYAAAQNPTGVTRTATLTIAGQTFTLTQPPSTSNSTALVTDIGIFRGGGSGGVLWVRDRNGDGLFSGTPDTAVPVNAFGTVGDLPLIGDWSGTGAKKFGVYRPAGSSSPGSGLFLLDVDGNETWNSNTDQALYLAPQAGDVPVIGRWNGGAKDQIGIFRNGTWYLDVNGNGTFAKVIQLGQAGDIPVVGDWNGSGTTKVGVFRNGIWILDYNGNGLWDGPSIDKFFYLGQAGDTPLVGDWNGSGTAKAGLYRNGLWVLDYNGNGQWDGIATDKALFNGAAGDTPVIGDWTGDGRAKAGVFHQGTWFLDVLGDGSFSRLGFLGQTADTPIVGKW